MHPLVWALLIGLVAIGGYELRDTAFKLDADRATIAMQYADAGLADARGAVTQDLTTLVAQQGTAGPFVDPAPSAVQKVCTDTRHLICPYGEQVSVHYAGSLGAGGVANTTANNLNVVAGVSEAPIYAQVTSVITDLRGREVARDSAQLTYRAYAFPNGHTTVVLEATNAPSSRANLVQGRDLGGCDPLSPASCGTNVPGAPGKTIESNYTRCQDDGDPSHGLCGSATPRPNNNYQTVQTHDGNLVP